jgi:C1A family cysteine protease
VGTTVRIRIAATLVWAVSLATLAGLATLGPALAQGEDPAASTGEGTEVGNAATITATLEASPTFESPVTPTFLYTSPLGGEELGSEVWSSEGLSLSDLGSTGEEYCLGVPLEVEAWEEEQAEAQGVVLSASNDYPPRIDWRDVGGKDFTTPVRRQGGCGSCVAFGTIGAIESRLEIVLRAPDLNPDLSEAHLFFCGSSATCQTGWWPSAAMDFARDSGIVDESCYPYSGQTQACSVCSDWQKRTTRIKDWVGLTDPAAMKETLAEQGPFEVVMVVYSDFYSYTGGVYRHTSGQRVGAHAVTLVGYDDEEGYWIAKNSWGTGWGENGWFRIAYGECAIDNYAYVPIMEQPDPLYHLSASVIPNGGGEIALDPTACAVDGCESGTELVLTAVPEAGYEFAGWGGDVSGDVESVQLVMDSDKEVTASFAEAADRSEVRFFVPLVF